MIPHRNIGDSDTEVCEGPRTDIKTQRAEHCVDWECQEISK